MTYKMWDKQSPINGKNAEQVIANNPVYSTDDVVVISNDDDTIVDALPVSYLPAGDTVAERCAAYIAQITPTPTDAQPSAIDALKERIAELELQNQVLEGYIIEIAQEVYK